MSIGLLEKVVKGDSEAIVTLERKYKGVISTALKDVHPSDRDDILQDFRLTLYSCATAPQTDKQIKNWLSRILKNLKHQLGRKRYGRYGQLASQYTGIDPRQLGLEASDGGDLSFEDYDEIRTAINKLSNRSRKVIFAAYFSKHPFSTYIEHHHLSNGCAYNHLNAALAQLRRILNATN